VEKPGPASGSAQDAQVAQLVEHTTENRSVGGSIPPLGTITPPAAERSFSKILDFQGFQQSYLTIDEYYTPFFAPNWGYRLGAS
jgi:hypothetical protein